MVRYSSRPGKNYQTNRRAPTTLPSPLAKEYRELQELRERVRKAEAAASRKAPAYRKTKDADKTVTK
jgi:hypothetical protein